MRQSGLLDRVIGKLQLRRMQVTIRPAEPGG
jgi:hypothetical protein